MEQTPVTLEIVDTPEKFRPMAETLVTPLVELLRSLSAAEAETMARRDAILAEKAAKGLPCNQAVPEEMALFQDHKARYGALLAGRCTPALLARGYGNSFGRPGAYDYLNTGCRLRFTMKSAHRAEVTAIFTQGTEMRQRFLLRDTPEGWLVDQVSYGFSGAPEKWHVDHI